MLNFLIGFSTNRIYDTIKLGHFITTARGIWKNQFACCFLLVFVFKKSKAFIDFQMVIITETYIDKKQPSVLLFYISHQKYQIRYKNQRPAEYTSIRDNMPTKIVRKKVYPLYTSSSSTLNILFSLSNPKKQRLILLFLWRVPLPGPGRAGKQSLYINVVEATNSVPFGTMKVTTY